MFAWSEELLIWTDVHQGRRDHDRYLTCMREIRDRRRFRVHLLGVRPRLRAQSGFALIEVVGRPALLLVGAGGGRAGIEGRPGPSAKAETRSQAGRGAQQDQAPVRSTGASALATARR